MLSSSLVVIVAIAVSLYALFIASFAARRLFGLAPLFMAIGAAEGVKYFVSTPFRLDGVMGGELSLGSTVFFTANVAIGLLVFVREGAATVRPMAWCTAAVAGLIALLMALIYQLAHWHDGDGQQTLLAGGLHGSWRVVVGTVLLMLSLNAALMLMTALLRRGFGIWLASWISLALVCAVDTFAYTSLVQLSWPNWNTEILPNIVGKLVIGGLFVSMGLMYLRIGEGFQVGKHFESVNAKDLFALLTYQDHLRQLEHDVNHDALTGVHNRRYLDSFVAEQVALNHRRKVDCAVLMIDVDRFKQVNDQFGHACGDRLLRHVAERIRARLRRGDMLCRYGGEEFVVCLSDTQMAEALRVAEMIRVEVQQSPMPDHAIDLTATISIGVAASPADGVHLHQLIHSADRRLYAAKSAGRNRVQGLELAAVA
jgi:diguanylate cyclase (GGDEF)-like protein